MLVRHVVCQQPDDGTEVGKKAKLITAMDGGLLHLHVASDDSRPFVVQDIVEAVNMIAGDR
jgi:hypothetical protein